MKRAFLGLALAIGTACNAPAQVTSSVGLSWLPDYNDADLVALAGSLGYRFQGRGGWSFQPEIRAGIGIVDDTVPLFSMSAVALVPSEIDVEYLLGAAARVQYRTDGGLYLIAQPTLTRLEIDAGSVTQSSMLEDTEWQFGGDIGAGYQFGERFALEATYGIIDEDAIGGAALRLYF